MPSHAVIARDVALRFRSGPEDVVALEGVSAAFDHGEFVAVMGASGSGKTSFLNVLAGLETPDSGHLCVAGQDLTALDDDARSDLRLREIGLVFQDDNLLPMLSARENVALPLRARGWSAGEAERESDLWLDRVGLGEQTGRRPGQLSGGQRQRVGLARAVAGGRRILLADEPTGALDSATTRAVFALLRDFAEDGVCVVVVSHDPSVRDFATAVHHMIDGHLVPGREAGA